ncbi:unnamed protein product [Heligmosomoides polygyrus]|uniref:C2H2-type domain-containing protein n=1 Tax=Heligmosomoides polygyrus TaxID=6339 RepID=A0A183FJ82_HELPZ|nr:unnamed protein product [Heligmosomoides polygyrus]
MDGLVGLGGKSEPGTWDAATSSNCASTRPVAQILMPKPGSWQCPFCEKAMLRKNLYFHMKAIHKCSAEQVEEIKVLVSRQAAETITPEEERVVCPLCRERFVSHELLAYHCNDEHSEDGAAGDPQDYYVFTTHFNSKTEFDEWLEEQQQRTMTSFVKRSTSDNGNSIQLRCSRSGKYVRKTDKATHTKKAVSHCSCFMNINVKSDGTVRARGCLAHVGHKVDPAQLRLTDAQRLMLKEMLEEYPYEYVLQCLRRDYPAETSKLHFITPKDLREFMVRYGIRQDARGKDVVQPQETPQQEENNLEEETVQGEDELEVVSVEAVEDEYHPEDDDVAPAGPTAEEIRMSKRTLKLPPRRSICPSASNLFPCRRMDRTTACHRDAMRHFDSQPGKVLQMSESRWRVSGGSNQCFEVQRIGECACEETEREGVHCPLCDVCPYMWSCSCGENRVGVGCMHCHAVVLYGNPHEEVDRVAEEHASESEMYGMRLEVRDPMAEEQLSESPTLSAEEVIEGWSAASPQQRKEERAQMRNAIEKKIAVVRSNVDVLVDDDSDDAMIKLIEIYDIIDTASKICLAGTEAQPRMTKAGLKRKQLLAQLYKRKLSRLTYASEIPPEEEIIDVE